MLIRKIILQYVCIFLNTNKFTDTCIKENLSNLGAVKLAFQNILEARACQWMCHKFFWCTTFTFNKKFQYCLLYQSASKQLDPYSVTGPRICGNSGGEQLDSNSIFSFNLLQFKYQVVVYITFEIFIKIKINLKEKIQYK